MRIALVFYRYGPYHRARLLAAREIAEVIGIEYTSKDHVYAWAKTHIPDEVPFFSFYSGPTRQGFRTHATYEKALRYLSEIKPDVVAIPGWATGFSLTMLRAARKLGIPAIVMSESQAIDFPRARIKEWLKKKVVSSYSSAVVGGKPHKEYMAQLGMKREAIFTGLDAVDNNYFIKSVHTMGGDRRRAPIFLASARFIEKKNLVGLLSAYRIYRDEVGKKAWGLKILGDGPLKDAIVDFIRKKQLENYVSLPGFIQYEELPLHYGQASVFVLPSVTEQWGLVVNEAMASGLPVLVSNRAGCATDLVVPGVNGWVFNPDDAHELAKLMTHCTLEQDHMDQMGHASVKIVTEWGAENFAKQLLSAARYAMKSPAPAASTSQLKVLDLLARFI